ncbi:MAG: zf-TFIIB domain-containing protein [Verrucomicrobiota bacterium]
MPLKPSDNEEVYFREQELKKTLEKSRQEQAAMAGAEKNRLKELHHMHCPKCGQKLVVEKYGAVEVDVCGGCRGLWLDANELDAIVENTKKRGAFHSFLKVLGK